MAELKPCPFCGGTLEQSTIDAVPVVQFVRCMNCTHWKKDVPGCTEYIGRCELANYMVGATGYCVYGERKENNNDC